MAVEALLDGEAERLTRKCIEAASGGDMVALRLCLERIAPLRKGRPVHFPLRGAPRHPQAWLKPWPLSCTAWPDGELTVDEAAGIASVIETQRRTIELSDIEVRLRKIGRASCRERV